MPYLTFKEYNDFGFTEMYETDFNRLLNKASDVLDNVTRNFYEVNNLEEDIPLRQEKFKKAVACQIEYFHEIGTTTSYGLNEPTSVTIGRTTQSNSMEQGRQNKLICEDIYLYLAKTGLLYRGIGVV